MRQKLNKLILNCQSANHSLLYLLSSLKLIKILHADPDGPGLQSFPATMESNHHSLDPPTYYEEWSIARGSRAQHTNKKTPSHTYIPGW